MQIQPTVWKMFEKLNTFKTANILTHKCTKGLEFLLTNTTLKV